MKCKGWWWKGFWPVLMLYYSIWMEGVKKTMKNLCQDSKAPYWDLNLGLSKHEDLHFWILKEGIQGVVRLRKPWYAMLFSQIWSYLWFTITTVHSTHVCIKATQFFKHTRTLHAFIDLFTWVGNCMNSYNVSTEITWKGGYPMPLKINLSDDLGV